MLEFTISFYFAASSSLQKFSTLSFFSLYITSTGILKSYLIMLITEPLWVCFHCLLFLLSFVHVAVSPPSLVIIYWCQRGFFAKMFVETTWKGSYLHQRTFMFVSASLLGSIPAQDPFKPGTRAEVIWSWAQSPWPPVCFQLPLAPVLQSLKAPSPSTGCLPGFHLLRIVVWYFFSIFLAIWSLR